MKIDRCFHPLTDRYAFDRCFSVGRGYAQIDTSQDASYFGTWANPAERKIIGYAEGDVTYQTAESDEEFAEAIRSISDWNREKGYTFGIDAGGSEELADRFEALGLGGFLQWGEGETVNQTLEAMVGAGSAHQVGADTPSEAATSEPRHENRP